jgi:3-hydroxy-9,10-secoandrosta-1,3,5(10)-triene-9,17-dione monooxygenase reductase component
MVIDSGSLRNALGTFVTGVTVVTTRADDGTDVGLTANSFNSVSLDPPLVLWSLAKASASLFAFANASHFVVHILAADQQPISDRFAKKGTDKFEDLAVDRGEDSVPLLRGCAARFHCRSTFQYDGGDHVIFVGEVVALDHEDVAPLAFHRGRYAHAAQRETYPDHGADLSHLIQRAHFHLLTPVRVERQRIGISLQEHYVLSVLLARSPLGIDQIDAIINYTGIRATAGIADGLVGRGLANKSDAGELSLTEKGRKTAIGLIAAAKAAEADALSQLNDDERVLLRSLLLRLLRGVGYAVDAPVSRHMELLGQIIEANSGADALPIA